MQVVLTRFHSVSLTMFVLAASADFRSERASCRSSTGAPRLIPMSLMASSASFPNNHNASTSFADPSQSHPSTTAPSITSIPSTASSPSPSSTRETLIPAEPKRTRSFSLLQNISMPFASRPTPLRASMTHADVSSTQMASSEPTNQHDLPQEIVLQIET